MNNNDAFAIAYRYHTLGRCVIPSGGGPDGKSALMLTRPAHTRDSRGLFTSSPNDRILNFIKVRDAAKELKPLELKFHREKLLYLPREERREREDDYY